jgi:hypothetical protein
VTAEAPPLPKKYPPVWVFDENRRRYAPNGKGGPIWRHHWVKTEIIGETRVSWITSGYGKIPKKHSNPMRVAWSLEDVERRAWAHDHVHAITDAIQRQVQQGGATFLDDIAARIGYEHRMPRTL